MRVINEKSSLINTLSDYKLEKKTIGLVPTMGALHEGHMELIRWARKECDVLVSTIYVNPTQFNNPDDLDKYPRTFDQDIELLTKNGCDIVFYPTDSEMYGNGSSVKIDFGDLGSVLEGEYRPNHFSGVGLIVSKFFNIVKPDFAYFGQKDLQQFAIIGALVQNLSFDLELRCVPTIRNTNGLALSSRNLRLTEDGKRNAQVFYQSLVNAKKMLERLTVEEVRLETQAFFEKSSVKLEYFAIVDKRTFKAVDAIETPENIAICVAGYVEGIRLIDNMLLN